jgi:Xaa-Pro aminopeptidase
MTKNYFGPRIPSSGRPVDYTGNLVDVERMRKDRMAKTREYLKKHDIAAALLMRPENIRYAGGTYMMNFIDRIHYTLAFADYDPVRYCTDGPEANKVLSPWIPEENIRQSIHWAQQSCGPGATARDSKLFAQAIKQDLVERGLAGEPLGIDEIDEPGRQALIDEGITLVNVQPAMLEARAVKTKDEIACVHMVASLCDSAHWDMYKALQPGMKDSDIRAIGYESLIRNGAEEIADVLVTSGGIIGGLSMDRDRLIQPGDMVTIDIVRATYLGYCSCYYRNFLVGLKPTQAQLDIQKKSYERVYSIIDGIKPGVSTGDLAQKWPTAASKGLSSDRALWCDDLMHGMGLWLYEYPVCNRIWSIEHPQILEAGMIMAVEAMEFDPNIGRTKIEDMVVVTETGCEVFSRIPVKEIMVANPFTLYSAF